MINFSRRHFDNNSLLHSISRYNHTCSSKILSSVTFHRFGTVTMTPRMRRFPSWCRNGMCFSFFTWRYLQYSPYLAKVLQTNEFVIEIFYICLKRNGLTRSYGPQVWPLYWRHYELNGIYMVKDSRAFHLECKRPILVWKNLIEWKSKVIWIFSTDLTVSYRSLIESLLK